MKRLVPLLLIAACGGSDVVPSEPAQSVAPESAEPEHEDKDGHKHNFPPSITAFHDTMAPLWHAAPSDERTGNTCASLDDMASKATAMASDKPAEAEQATWDQVNAALAQSLAGLATVCSGERAGFADGFKSVHEAFHKVVETIKHGEH